MGQSEIELRERKKQDLLWDNIHFYEREREKNKEHTLARFQNGGAVFLGKRASSISFFFFFSFSREKIFNMGLREVGLREDFLDLSSPSTRR